MLFFNGIKIVSCLAVLVLMHLAYGERCSFLSRDKVECEDCKAPYLVRCEGKVGYVSGAIQATLLKDYDRSYYGDSYFTLSVKQVFSKLGRIEAGKPWVASQSLHAICDGSPLYKTPLGETVVAIVGYKKEDHQRQCRYTVPSMPNKVKTHLSEGLEWKVCYGHVVCDVGLEVEGLELAEAQTELFPVACTETLDGRCPTARECMEDTAVEFSQVASETEQEESQFRRNQQLEQMIMTAVQVTVDETVDDIRATVDDFQNENWDQMNENWDKIQKRIDEEIQIQTARQRAMEAWMVDEQKAVKEFNSRDNRSPRARRRAQRRSQ